MSVSQIVIEQFDPSKIYNGIKQFDCDHVLISNFAKKSLKQNVKKDISQAYVLLDTSKDDLFVGYYNVMTYSVAKEDFHTPPSGVTKQIPVLRLVMLGVDKAYTRQKLGSRLLKHALELTLRISSQVGVTGLYLDAEDGKHYFYRKRAFISIKDADPLTNILPMFISIETIKDALT